MNCFHMHERAQRPITADKKEIKDFPKLPSATSFIRKTMGGGLAGCLRG
jgi:hypothetical protein